jgi:hypothetical protein
MSNLVLSNLAFQLLNQQFSVWDSSRALFFSPGIIKVRTMEARVNCFERNEQSISHAQGRRLFL